jgi:D-alanyl-D-alanine carboxypeptidase
MFLPVFSKAGSIGHSSPITSYFSETALKDFASSLGPLGTAREFTQIRQRARGGMLLRVYRVRFPQKTLKVWTFEMPDGKLEQYQVAAVE